MEDYVLFSSIGGHDPIANYHDGAMLHICRTYKPKKIYLYLTKEMLERSSKDNRYCESLKKLQRHLNYTIEEIQTIERPNLTEVHIFDTFFNDFESIINEIHEKNPNETILLNLSSGTPAMKSALNIIATMARYKKMVAVQVPTPTGKENAKDEDHDKFDLDVYWELDEDNRPDWKSRCKEIVSINLMAKINKEIIIRFIKAYDYSAALSVSKDIADFLPENSLNFLTAAYCRLQLDQSGYDKALNGTGKDFMPIKSGNKRKVFEYILSLQVKQKQGNYSDFIRALTPVILDLFEECLKETCAVDIKNYCEKVQMKNGDCIYKLSPEKLQSDLKGREISDILCKTLKDGKIEEKPYSSFHIFPIIQYYSKDCALVKDLKQLRDIEENLRNITAHEIVSVTEDWMYRRVGLNSSDILSLLKRVVGKAGFNIKKDYWNSYDEMNKTIIDTISLLI